MHGKLERKFDYDVNLAPVVEQKEGFFKGDGHQCPHSAEVTQTY